MRRRTGKEKGEKRPGEKKKLGRLAAQAWEKAQEHALSPDVGAPPHVRNSGAWLPPTAAPMPAMAVGGAGHPDDRRTGLDRRTSERRARSLWPRRRVADRTRLSAWVMGATAIAAELALAAWRRRKVKA